MSNLNTDYSGSQEAKLGDITVHCFVPTNLLIILYINVNIAPEQELRVFITVDQKKDLLEV